MKAQLVRWGNSLAVRIPKPIVEQAGLDEGEELNVSARAGRIAIEKTRTKLTLKKLLEGIRPDNVHGEQDWGPPVGKEIW